MIKQTRAGAATVVTIDDERRRNPVSVKAVAEIAAAVDAACANPETRAIVIAGAGKTFSAGGDFDDMSERDLAGWRRHFDHVHRSVRTLIRANKPIFAAVEGWAVGAGLSLALCCDTVILGDTARLMYGFDRMGLVADMGLWFTLPRRVGAAKAKQIMLYGGEFDAAAAASLGLADEVVGAGTALARAIERAQQLSSAAPLPIGVTKAFLARGLDEELDEELNLAPGLFASLDHREALRAFAEKKAPHFVGR